MEKDLFRLAKQSERKGKDRVMKKADGHVLKQVSIRCWTDGRNILVIS